MKYIILLSEAMSAGHTTPESMEKARKDIAAANKKGKRYAPAQKAG